jgi:hypothetical protein
MFAGDFRDRNHDSEFGDSRGGAGAESRGNVTS